MIDVKTWEQCNEKNIKCTAENFTGQKTLYPLGKFFGEKCEYHIGKRILEQIQIVI